MTTFYFITALYLDRFGIFGGYGGSNILIHISVALNAVASSVWLSACCMASVIRGSTKILAAIASPIGLKQLASAFTENWKINLGNSSEIVPVGCLFSMQA